MSLDVVSNKFQFAVFECLFQKFSHGFTISISAICDFVFCVGHEIIPASLQMNINANKSIAKSLVKIGLIMHLDASGKETFFMEWLKSPREQPDLFGNMGVSIPKLLMNIVVLGHK